MDDLKKKSAFKKADKKQLDKLFHQYHNEVFEETDCLKCANCCKTTSPIVKETDIERISEALRIKPGMVIDKFLIKENDGTYIMNAAPCPFLLPDNFCSIYKNRPAACREYPHTNRKNMFQILDLTFKNIEICPAVEKIIDKISRQLN